MKKVGVVLALLGLAALVGVVAYVSFAPSETALLELSAEETMFHDYKAHHRKTYFNEEEHNFRFHVWRTNRYKIMEHNANPDKTFTMGINQFTDMTSEEFLKHYTGANPDLMPQEEEARTVYYDSVLELPSSVDWSQTGAVTGVKNQGRCGSCWAFSSTGALEGAYYLKNKNLKSLSEQQLVDCTYGKGNYGCNGGMPYNSFRYWEKDLSEQEQDYSYTATDGSCHYDSAKGVTKDANFYHVSASDNQIKQAVAARPLSVCVDATPLQHYSSGVVSHNSCSTRINHAVLMVGYANGAWKVKNSWGASWGEKGYFWLEQGYNSCGVQSYVYYPTI